VGDAINRVSTRNGSLDQVIQFKHPKSHFHKLLEVNELMSIEDKDVFPVAKAQDLHAMGIFPVEVRAEVQPTHLGPECQKLAAGHLYGLFPEYEKKATLCIALIGFEVTGFVE